MSRKEQPTVKTGGEMGQILDHLLCARDRAVQMDDARAALRLHAAVCAQRDRYEEALREIVGGAHGEYCGDGNYRLTLGGKVGCDSGCPVSIARAALAGGQP